ncbi:MAG: monovalent cation/H(+) antiporter subunit G [Hyphomicrobiaceae bacterium]|jgi:multicomponent Na+:H+ antiporter subunit G
MIDGALYYLSYVLVVAGAFFIVVGAIGLVRMPDVFTRMHATSVTETAGAGLLIAGLMLQAGLSLLTLKLFFVLAVFFLTAPVATHALAQAALQAGIEPLLQHDHRDSDGTVEQPSDTPAERES